MAMKLVTFGSNEIAVKTVNGGAELYQGARRGYLEFVFDKNDVTVEELDRLFLTGVNEVTITDIETGESFVHGGYVVRGPIRVYPVEADGNWEVAVRQYQRTAMEEMLAAMEARLALLERGKE